MPSVNAFWEACGVSVSITCLSFTRSSCSVSLVPMSSTYTRSGPIKASNNTSQNDMVSLFLWITRAARSSLCQSWVDYTTIIAEVLELLRVYDEADGCIMWSAPLQGAGIPSFLCAVLH